MVQIQYESDQYIKINLSDTIKGLNYQLKIGKSKFNSQTISMNSNTNL